MKKDAADVLQRIELSPDMPLAKKMALMGKYDRLNKLSEQLASTAANANNLAQKIIDKEMVNVYEGTYNSSAYNFGFDLVDHSAVKKILSQEENPYIKISALSDKQAITNKMKGELMTGLLKGESMQKISRRLKNTSEGYLKNTIRVARTETMRVENSAKMDVGEHGKELGLKMYKRWIATHDDRVRDDHLAMDGKEVPQDEPFVLPDGTKMMFPCDISLGADAGQVINCRCTMVEFVKEEEQKSIDKPKKS